MDNFSVDTMVFSRQKKDFSVATTGLAWTKISMNTSKVVTNAK